MSTAPTDDPTNHTREEAREDGPAMTDAPALPPGRFLELPGRGTTFVRELPGPPDAPVLVLLHGWTATADLNWFNCYEPLAANHRILAMDLRGHGRGLRPRRPTFRLEDCADDVAAVLDVLGIERAVPVGYSMGGAVAQLVAHRHPDRTRAAVLCATSGSFRASGSGRLLWEGVMPAAALALTLTPATLRTRALRQFLLVRADGAAPAWMLEELARNDAALVAQAGIALGRFDSAPWAATLRPPTAVVVMTKDGTVPPDRQHRLAASLSRATVHLAETDHRGAVTEPDRFLPALGDALRSVLSRT